SLGSYMALGFQHILEGWDHLAFVLALLLLARSLKEVALLVTTFTVAHSVTLALAATGLVRPSTPQVEIIIAFSIALVAAENCWALGGRRRSVQLTFVAAPCVAMGLASAGYGTLRAAAWLGLALFSFCHFELLKNTQRPQRLRALLAFAFGLYHGFGFAGVLMEVELPQGRLLPALFGFNVGVEVGQLLVVALVFPLLAALGRLAEGRWRQLVAEVSSAAVLGLGLYWVMVRSWGP
ncbi:MAG: HupE/UreJ family protein, partial [Planctomycetota bacterium]